MPRRRPARTRAAAIRPGLDILNAAIALGPSGLTDPEVGWLAEYHPEVYAGLADWTPPESDHPDPRITAIAVAPIERSDHAH